MPEGIFRRRHLPHWDVEGKPCFITACLAGSISAKGMKRIRQYRRAVDAKPRPEHLSEQEWERNKNKLVFALVDHLLDLLDHESPVGHLADTRQAEIVQNSLLHFAGERYTLLAFVIMPSHYHWLFLPDEGWSCQVAAQSWRPGKTRTPREVISHSVQSFTATMCNRIRGTSGGYWQEETFDHWARDEAEMHRIIDYIERNPVKAGLVEFPEQWQGSSARVRAAAGTSPGDPIIKPAQ